MIVYSYLLYRGSLPIVRFPSINFNTIFENGTRSVAQSDRQLPNGEVLPDDVYAYTARGLVPYR